LLDLSQDVTDTYTYEAFGNLMGSSGSTPNLAKRRLHRGRRRRHGGAAWPHLATCRYVASLGYYATGSSLQHLGARYYLPEVGRFLQVDPATRLANRYAYLSNKPCNDRDPAGLQGEDEEGCLIVYINCIKAASWKDAGCRIGCGIAIGFVGSIGSVLACGAALSTGNPVLIAAACAGLPLFELDQFKKCWKACDEKQKMRAKACQDAYDQCRRKCP
jgi:RHS repeat-associated protein